VNTVLVFSMSVALAHVVRTLEVARVLREMGYRVVFAGDGNPLRLARQEGFEVRPLPELDLKWALANLGQPPEVQNSVERIEHWVRAELDLLEQVQPAAVLDDFRLTSGISTAVMGIPRIVIINAYVTSYAVRGLWDSLPLLPGPPSMMGPGTEQPYNQVRQRYGLPPVARAVDLLEGDTSGRSLNLLCDVPEYAPIQAAPDHYRYVGPLTWDGLPDPPPWLDSLDPDRPTIYFTMGSTGPVEAFQAALDAFGDTGYQMLITTGGVTRPEDLGPTPANCHVAGYGPGDKLMRWADVVICHAGNGTTYQALHAGLPIIAWPFVQDQRWNARRQAELGVGLTLESLTPAALRAAVEEVQSNPSYRAAAQRFQQILASYDGPRTAARLIHQFIR